jgi:hypothetical protein
MTVDNRGMNATENTDNVNDAMNRQLPGKPGSEDDRRQACDLASKFPSSSLISSLITPGKLTDGARNDINKRDIQSQVQDSAQELANEQGERRL